MELRNLITFLKIIETGSFSNAAEQLTYSQSTVTVQIQQLEKELNVQLFDRIGKKIYITEKGRELEAYAQQIVALSQKAAAIGGEEQELQGTLRIACLDSLFTAVLPDILREYHQRHPQVDIIVKTADNVFDAERHLSQNEVDLAFITHDQRSTQNFIKTILLEAQLVFTAAPSHPLAKKDIVTLAEIAENDVIITNQQFYSDISNEHTKNTLSYIIRPRFDLWNPIAAMELAKLDCGIALLPTYLIEDAVEKSELCVLNVPELHFPVWLQVLHHEQKAITPQMNAFLKLLQEYYHL
ncbi:LysR family transcriptional regulator [Anaerotignum sp.]|nr:LysR family transcriptional regulator [Anaerotignum sp.]MBQ7759073.1 LysR family transcriptional regulator [Anaerotignum sp.]